MSSPPHLTVSMSLIPPREMITISVEPAPISTTIVPFGSAIGSPAPIAAARPSLITRIFCAPAFLPISSAAFFSTSDASPGIPITILPTLSPSLIPICIALMSKACACTTFSITPFLSGLTARISSGVLPNIFLASSPTAKTSLGSSFLTATTDGIWYKSNLSPDGLAITVFKVPKSIPKLLLITLVSTTSCSSSSFPKIFMTNPPL